MDDSSNSPGQEKGDQQASVLPIPIHEGNLPEISGNVLPFVSKTTQFQMLSLTILVLTFAPGGGTEGSPGDCTLPTRLGGARRP